MHFNGIWIPKDVVFTVFLGWGIVALIILALVFWPKRTKPLEHRSVKSMQVPKHRAKSHPRSNLGKSKVDKIPKRRP